MTPSKPACLRYPGRIYVRGCDCTSCVKRKKFHAENKRLREKQVKEFRAMMDRAGLEVDGRKKEK